MKIKGAVLREVNKGYSIEELELDPPKAGEVLVKYAYTGYCHSDLSNTKGRTTMGMPHGGRSRVRRRGRGGRAGRHPGQAGRPRGQHLDVPCGDCPECRKGMGNICSGNFAALRRRHHARRHQPHQGREGQDRPARQLRVRASPTTPSCPRAASSRSARTCRSTRPPHELLHPDRLGHGHQAGQRAARRQRSPSGASAAWARTPCGRPRCGGATRSSRWTSRRRGARRP